MSRHYRVLCGVPDSHCVGSPVFTDQTLSNTMKGKHVKVHNTHADAFRCHANYLTRVLGYEQLGARDFAPPDGGPVRMLTKKSRFGEKLRSGKSEEGTGRFMPRHRENENLAGVIVSL